MEAITGVAWTSMIGGTVNTMLAGNFTMFWTSLGLVGATGVIDYVDTRISSRHGIAVQQELIRTGVKKINRSSVRLPWRNPFLKLLPHTETASWWQRNGTHLMPFHIARMAAAAVLPYAGMLLPMLPSAAAGSGPFAATALALSTAIPTLAVLGVGLREARLAKREYSEEEDAKHEMMQVSEGLEPGNRELRLEKGELAAAEGEIDREFERWSLLARQHRLRDARYAIVRRAMMGASLFAPALASIALGIEHTAGHVAQIAGYTFAATVAQMSAFEFPAILKARAQNKQALAEVEEIAKLARCEVRTAEFGIQPEDVVAIDFRSAGYVNETAMRTDGVFEQPCHPVETRVKVEDIKGIVELDLTVLVNAGARLAIVGPSGAGKTTFTKLLRGVLLPNQGSIVYILKDGSEVDARECPKEFRTRLMSSALQDGRLDASRRTVREAIAPTEGIGDDRLREAIRLIYNRGDSTSDFDAQLVDRLYQQLSRPIDQISGGQRQRLATLGALLQRSPVLLADEPGAGLDVMQRKLVYQGLARAADKSERLLIVATHDIPEVFALGAEILVIGPHPQRSNVSTITQYIGVDGEDVELGTRARRLAPSDARPLMGDYGRMDVERLLDESQPTPALNVRMSMLSHDVRRAYRSLGIAVTSRPSAVARYDVEAVVTRSTLVGYLRQIASAPRIAFWKGGSSKQEWVDEAIVVATEAAVSGRSSDAYFLLGGAHWGPSGLLRTPLHRGGGPPDRTRLDDVDGLAAVAGIQLSRSERRESLVAAL